MTPRPWRQPKRMPARTASPTNCSAWRLRRCPRGLPEERADYLVANILAGPLIELAPRLAALVRPGGALALSGLLHDQVGSVAAAYAPWFDLEPPAIQEDWVLLAGRRRERDPAS
jgi:ribosomal protein L11 methylase PrmA